ncbi:hypothetical protein BDZ97DRAFT_58644 [Flammula alnicola]|nr:hypothetical protein BDZ97DRAFT_58644 [Flammula alnicola]
MCISASPWTFPFNEWTKYRHMVQGTGCLERRNLDFSLQARHIAIADSIMPQIFLTLLTWSYGNLHKTGSRQRARRSNCDDTYRMQSSFRRRAMRIIAWVTTPVAVCTGRLYSIAF